ncbi:MAG: hypothetical protein HYV09_13575, partial [Deltaproteobacteria bacterium]|nr:hypothetical protein [Deltaproteobacteria bacterium]
MSTRRSGVLSHASFIAAASVVILAASTARAEGSGEVDTFYGSFGTEVPVEVPVFHGLEPRLKLAYSSTGGDGLAGVGFGLGGFGGITRGRSGGGAPRWDGGDAYFFDGQELVPCAAGSSSPSCLSGGTHSTKIESYTKIRFDGGTNAWSVWQKDGTRSTYAA